MLDFKEKQILKKIIYSKFTLIFLIFLLVIVVKGVWRVYGEAKMTKENRILAQQELEELENRKRKIELKLEELNSDLGLEKEIRNKFSVVKEGEKMIMILDEKKSNYKSDLKKDNFWSKILDWFK